MIIQYEKLIMLENQWFFIDFFKKKNNIEGVFDLAHTLQLKTQ